MRFDSSTGTMLKNIDNTIERKKLIAIWKQRPFSWSQKASWDYSKDQWAYKYIFGIEDGGNNLMRFGNVVGDSLGTPDSMCPAIEPHFVGSSKEFELTAKLNGLTLVGYADFFHEIEIILDENKTSINPNRWDQKAVDNHGQLTMYALMLFLTHKIKPETVKMWLNFIPVKETQTFEMALVDPNLFHRFPTKRTTRQVLDFGASLGKTIKDMEAYALTVPTPPSLLSA